MLTEAKRKQSCIMYPVYTVKVISIFKENIFKGVREEWPLAVEYSLMLYMGAEISHATKMAWC